LLLLTLATFGTGFLMRPNGAVLLGSYTDRHGRRSGLFLILSLMATGTATFALTPSYSTIGLLAPLIVGTGTASSKVPEEEPSQRSYRMRLLL
jgi:MHS family citrate/tricarballylate:H+ symporter-like MFS transporter